MRMRKEGNLQISSNFEFFKTRRQETCDSFMNERKKKNKKKKQKKTKRKNKKNKKKKEKEKRKEKKGRNAERSHCKIFYYY